MGKVAIEGHCTEGCGQCCETVVLPVVRHPNEFGAEHAVVELPDSLGDGFRAFLAARGVAQRGDGHWVVPLNRLNDGLDIRWISYGPRGELVMAMRSTCPHLTADKRCDLYGTPERPQVCERYPTADDDLSLVPKCTYRKVRA